MFECTLHAISVEFSVATRVALTVANIRPPVIGTVCSLRIARTEFSMHAQDTKRKCGPVGSEIVDSCTAKEKASIVMGRIVLMHQQVRSGQQVAQIRRTRGNAFHLVAET